MDSNTSLVIGFVLGMFIGGGFAPHDCPECDPEETELIDTVEQATAPAESQDTVFMISADSLEVILDNGAIQE